MTATAVDRAVDQLAASQHGAIAHRQVLALGGSDGIIERRLSGGRWIRLAPAVYAVAAHPPTWHQQAMAAVLGERDAVVGGVNAAVLHGLTGFRSGPIQIVVPRGANHRSGLAVVRESRDIRRTRVHAIPVLTVCDTLFAVAATAHPSRVGRALDDALGAHIVDLDEIELRLQELRGGRRPGVAVMRRLLAPRRADAFVPPSSVLEDLLYQILDRLGMPPYQRQARVPWSPDQRVDALLIEPRLIVEADGRRWHTRLADFERDRARDRTALVHGYRTLRYTYAQLRGDPEGVEAEVRSVARAAA